MRLTTKYRVQWDTEENSVLKRAWKRFERDIRMTLLPDCGRNQETVCFLIRRMQVYSGQEMEPESYVINVSQKSVELTGADELGIIYGLLEISSRFLGITPFWFWNDQVFEKKKFAEIPEGIYHSRPYCVRYRGWFINDEVLLDAWGKEAKKAVGGIVENEAWEMAMEALLRLGGNMVIPGTDHNSHKYRQLAVDMGLWITHHHAEPLGARMFARAYPELTPSYAEHPELFHKLWQEAVEEQKNNKTIWNLGFRGQGDRPFWEEDPAYDTPQKRGKLIGDLILRQYSEVANVIKNPVCCTNLYGEIMELYQMGYLTLPESVIAVWADNGYGKMVSRRQGNHNPRADAMPEPGRGRQGIYYHASFYDLQAAAHITMLPNSTEFVKRELKEAINRGAEDFLIVNCSNVKPHTYLLDTIAEVWGKQKQPYEQQYFPEAGLQVKALYREYFDAMLHYGPNEDDRAGEQFYHYTMRSICQWWSLGREECMESLRWLTGDVFFEKQVEIVNKIVSEGIEKLENLYSHVKKAGKELKAVNFQEGRLLEDSLVLQAEIHYRSADALRKLCIAYEKYKNADMEMAFFLTGNACELVNEILSVMKRAEHDKWKDFYANDCLTDIKFTKYSLENVMRYVRSLGDGPYYYQWALKYCYGNEEQKVVLITNMRNHPGDWELYAAMKKRREDYVSGTDS